MFEVPSCPGDLYLTMSQVFATLTDPSVSVSDKENSVGRDIATLTRACIANTQAKATAMLYQRIALIESQA